MHCVGMTVKIRQNTFWYLMQMKIVDCSPAST